MPTTPPYSLQPDPSICSETDQADKFKVASLPSMTAQAAFLEASITNLPTIDPDVPVYARPIGQNFDSEWVKAAKEAKRREMTRPPPGVHLTEGELDQMERDDVEKTLDLADWEKDIVFDSL
jgi:hypothetical protein